MKKFIILIAVVLFVFSVGAFGVTVGHVTKHSESNSFDFKCHDVNCNSHLLETFQEKEVQGLKVENDKAEFEKNSSTVVDGTMCPHLACTFAADIARGIISPEISLDASTVFHNL